MTRETVVLVAALSVAAWTLTTDAKDPDEKLWTAVRKGNVAKVQRMLGAGVSPESRTVALSTSVSHDEPTTFRLLWDHDNSDISPDVIDFALCYAYRNPTPHETIQSVLDERGLSTGVCCERNRKQSYCAAKPIRLTREDFPATECRTVYTEEHEVPAGSTPIATLWDERVSMLDSASSARYGPPELSRKGARDWAMEFAPMFGELGADAILISVAETVVDSANTFKTNPRPDGSATPEGFVFGTITDRIEIVAIRTRPPD